MSDAVNVCGLVVHAAPRQAAPLAGRLAALDGVDVYLIEGDRLVLTVIDTPEITALARMAEMNRIPGVVSTSLAYHQVEEPEGHEPSECSCNKACACSQSGDLAGSLAPA